MARRKTPTLATGSMADIAFLLLVFWLMTTTLDSDIGLIRKLNSIEDVDPDPIDDINVLEVYVNKNDELLVEKEAIEIQELKNIARDFYSNSGAFDEKEINEKYTIRRYVDKEIVENKVALYSKGKSYASLIKSKEISDTLRIWLNKLITINQLREYRELRSDAVISIQNDMGTSYEKYIQVQNELAQALNELRDELSIEYFKIPFEGLDQNEDREKIIAIRTVFPQRISEADIVDNR